MAWVPPLPMCPRFSRRRPADVHRFLFAHYFEVDSKRAPQSRTVPERRSVAACGRTRRIRPPSSKPLARGSFEISTGTRPNRLLLRMGMGENRNVLIGWKQESETE